MRSPAFAGCGQARLKPKNRRTPCSTSLAARPANDPSCFRLSPYPLKQTQLRGDRLHRVDDELDVPGQVHAEVGCAALDILTLHRPGKALRLHLFLDAGGG